jgi:hypothetical protein
MSAADPNVESRMATLSSPCRTRSPQLLAKRFPGKDDPHALMTHAKFLARAWKLANDKARELGCI